MSFLHRLFSRFFFLLNATIGFSKNYGKHKYDIKNRPKQNELAAHLHKDHHIEEDLEIHILDYGIHHLGKRTRTEDRLICKLQTMSPHGMNELIGPYAKEMYASWSSILLTRP